MDRRIAPFALTLLSAIGLAAPVASAHDGEHAGETTHSSIRVQVVYDVTDARHASLLDWLATHGERATPAGAPTSPTRGGPPGALGPLAIDATRHFKGEVPEPPVPGDDRIPDVGMLTTPGPDGDTFAIRGCDANAFQSWNYRREEGRWLLVSYSTSQRDLRGGPACPVPGESPVAG